MRRRRIETYRLGAEALQARLKTEPDCNALTHCSASGFMLCRQMRLRCCTAVPADLSHFTRESLAVAVFVTLVPAAAFSCSMKFSVMAMPKSR
jgi:hypothetical protein